MNLVASLEYIDRTELMKKAIREFLKDVVEDLTFKERVVERYFEGKLPFEKLEII